MAANSIPKNMAGIIFALLKSLILSILNPIAKIKMPPTPFIFAIIAGVKKSFKNLAKKKIAPS